MSIRASLGSAVLAAAIAGGGSAVLHAQTPASSGQQATPTQPIFGITVVEIAPLPGVELPLQKIPAPVQTATSEDLEKSGALDLSTFLNSRMTGVHINEIQNNPFQADVNYRGYTASPLLGTPQGLSIYMDGVRLNQPFGDTVSWDLIPRIALSSTTLMPGSNPLFGLNTLGGALALQTKDGRQNGGTRAQATYGSDNRRMFEFEHGGFRDSSGLDWYLAGSLFGEDGWRDDSPTDVGQVFGKLGWRRDRGWFGLSAAYADSGLTGNGLQELSFLERDRAGVYTKPDTTGNASALVTLSASRTFSPKASLSANAYYRRIATDTLNGDINEDSLDQPVYQPNAAERAALTAAGYTGFPASGENASNTPFPYWRCIAQGLLAEEPAEKCNGLINTTDLLQHNGGLAGQYNRRDPVGSKTNQFTFGAAYDHSSSSFQQATELGYLNADRSVTGIGAFGDGVTGGDVDGEPYDTRVDLDGVTDTWSLYGTDTLSIGSRWDLTLSGRFNRTSLDNSDRIDPGGGPGSLDGSHTFSRLNPAAGVTFNPSADLGLYAGYSEGSRAPTSIELGCADPEEPCKLPNAMAGDPPLEQVVARTWEGGGRGIVRGIRWGAGIFGATNTNDILFVTSEQTGFGYFRNFGRTRRQGFELTLDTRVGRAEVGAGYTFISATYRSEETVNGESNSSNDGAEAGEPGLEGTIEIEPGDRIPLVPRHLFKAYADFALTGRLSMDVSLVSAAGSLARGNENSEHEPDDVYYLGPGEAAGYAVVNLGTRYRVNSRFQIVGQISNLFDTDYETAGQLGPMGFTDDGAFIARPLPAIDGEFPIRNSTFFAPGAPFRAWGGIRLAF